MELVLVSNHLDNSFSQIKNPCTITEFNSLKLGDFNLNSGQSQTAKAVC